MPLVVVALAYASTLRFALVADARLLIVENRLLRGWENLGPNLAHDYFWSSSGASIPYWRPLTKGGWLVEQQLGDGSPIVFHLVQLGWLLLAMVAVQALVRRLGGSALAAGTASLLFALHPSLVEPTALVMARSDLVAAAGLGGAVVGFLDWRDGKRGGLFLHVAALVVALGSKESGVLALPIVALLWLTLERPVPVQRSRLVELAPVVGLTTLYLGLRAVVLAGTEPAGVIFDPLRVAIAGATYLRNLNPLRVTSAIRNLPIAEAQSQPAQLVALATWLMLLIVAIGLWRSVRRGGDRRAIWLTLAILLPLAPVLMVKKVYVPSIEGKLALADRWLLGSLLFSSAACGWMLDRAVRRWRHALPLFAMLIVSWSVVRVVRLPRELRLYATELALLAKDDEAYERTPPAFRTAEDRCRFADRALLRAAAANDLDGAERAYREQPSGCAVRIDGAFNLLALLVRNGRHAAARPIVDAISTRPAELDERNQGPFAYLAGAVLTETGDPARGEQLLKQAMSRGVLTCGVLEALSRAFAQQGKTDEAALATQRAAQCRGAKP